LDFNKDGLSVLTAKNFQLWFLVIQKSVIYLGLVRLFTKHSKNVWGKTNHTSQHGLIALTALDDQSTQPVTSLWIIFKHTWRFR